MRIDLTNVAAAASVPATRERNEPHSSAATSVVQAPRPSAAPSRTVEATPGHKVDVSFDRGQHIIYRVVDGKTGDVIQQVPPEELLRVMRNIGEYLQKLESKI